MDIVIDIGPLVQFFNLPTDQMLWSLWINFGWIILGCIFIYGVRSVYYVWLQGKWSIDHKCILLAIDIPKGNEQSPKAVENLFTYLAGAHGSINFFEKWFIGMYQKPISLEVVSIDGYTQFLIYTPIENRSLIESSVYSQYPDAEISEVDDYTKAVPQSYPDEEYDFWGVEFVLADNWVYPIKMYQEFEHQMGPSETQFKDPMASLIDLCGTLRQGEQLWYQIVIKPIDLNWANDSQKEIDKILERKAKPKKDLIMKGVEVMGEASEVIYSIWGDIEEKKDEKKPKSMLELSPDEKRKVEAIHLKASKLGFETKVRFIYMAKKEVKNNTKVVNGFVGFMKQFISLGLNNLKPDMSLTATKTAYFFRESRLITKKRKLFSAYINRSAWVGRLAGIMNIEELATIWHFPVEANVKSAMIQKAPGRKADAPSSLPLAEELTSASDEFLKSDIFKNNIVKEDSNTSENNSEVINQNSINQSNDDGDSLDKKKVSPPSNLPFA